MNPRSLARLAFALTLLPSLLVFALCADAQTVFPSPDWEVAQPETQAMSAAALDKVGQWLKDSGAKTGLVVRHGRIVGEWYFDDATAASKYLVYSTTKSFSSVATGLAIADGKLTLDSKVGDFFSDANPPEKREITVRQLLSMTSARTATTRSSSAKTCSLTCSTSCPWTSPRARSGNTTTRACRC